MGDLSWMTLGLATTGVVALVVAHSPATLDVLLGNRILFYARLFGQLGLVVALGALATRVGTAVAALCSCSCCESSATDGGTRTPP